ncbi:MAG: bifunctional alpha/beta hydrolase/OsmC family protein [Saprospiraceae bacterium]|nr:bifunctional alpha/beta hydrolase/OsmC family protein [Saprospiraceae bacterium]
MPSKKVQFINKNGYTLSARLEFPLTSKPEAFAVFAHVFTGSKSLSATRHISRALTLNGIAVLRFDFTGLGESEGDFSDTNFTSNVEDLLAACRFLRDNYEPPSIMIGHSLGGAASVFAASKVDTIKAVATIGAPSEPEHVTHLLTGKLEDIEKTGMAEVNIGGQVFTIKKHFLDDLRSKNMYNIVRNLNKAILVLHSPQDRVVEIENAAKIYHAAMHPKSFVTLNDADHMLTNKNDAFYVGNVVATWAKRYVDLPMVKNKLSTHKDVVARLGSSGYTTDIMAGKHGMIADESEDLGGADFGPSPYEMLNAALGACTAMTLQMYARRKKWDLSSVEVHLSFTRSYKEDCEHCDIKDRRLEVFDREISIKGDLDVEQINRLLEIANRCPVHRTLEASAEVRTRLLHS